MKNNNNKYILQNLIYLLLFSIIWYFNFEVMDIDKGLLIHYYLELFLFSLIIIFYNNIKLILNKKTIPIIIKIASISLVMMFTLIGTTESIMFSMLEISLYGIFLFEIPLIFMICFYMFLKKILFKFYENNKNNIKYFYFIILISGLINFILQNNIK